MRLARFTLIQALLLGSGAFLAWSALTMSGQWLPSLTLDSLGAWLFALVLVTAFLFLVALPTQLAVRRFGFFSLSLVVGVASGPLGVILGMFALTRYPLGWEYYIQRAQGLHIVFAGVGLCFAWALHATLRPNNSFKPNPLRGSA